MRVSIVIATFGADDWRDTAWSHAYPSAVGQGALEVLVHHEPEGTLASSRNAAAAHAQGEALIYLDADDQLAPGYLDAMRKGLDSLVAANTLLVPAVQYVRNGVAEKPHIPQQGQWPKFNVAVIGTAISRTLFMTLGGFRDLPIYEDWDLWIRAASAGAALAYMRDAVYVAHLRAGSRNAGTDAKLWYDRIVADHADFFRNRHDQPIEL